MSRCFVLPVVLMMLVAPLEAKSQAFSVEDGEGAEQSFQTLNVDGCISELSTFRIIHKSNAAGKSTLDILQIRQSRDNKNSEMALDTIILKQIYSADKIISLKENFVDDPLIKNKLKEQGLEVKFTATGDDISIPSQPIVGAKLPDEVFSVNFEIEGVAASIDVTSSDRQILKKEKIKVPAGEFDTYLMEGNSLAKVSILFIKQTEKLFQKQWIVPGRGVVKSESYNKRGKKESITEMISYKN